MPASEILVEVRVRVAWWLRPYLTVAVLMHRLGLAVDFDCVLRAIDAAIVMQIGHVGHARPWRHVFSDRLAA